MRHHTIIAPKSWPILPRPLTFYTTSNSSPNNSGRITFSVTPQSLGAAQSLTSFIIPWNSLAFSYSNSSFHVAGGFSNSHGFWHFQLSSNFQVCTAKAKSDSTTSIDTLKYVALIITYVVASMAFHHSSLPYNPIPSPSISSDWSE